jgi:DNA-binding NarL/FixJ family response regulator
MKPYRILLAEEQASCREEIKRILKRIHSLELIGEVTDGLELMRFLETALPDLIILDITMPHFQGLEAIKKIKTVYRGVKVLILTKHKSGKVLQLVFSVGADGFLLKENAHDDLIAAIAKIRQGGHYISRLMSNEIISIFRRGPKERSSIKVLSYKEQEMLNLISQGKTGREIAEQLAISIHTVENRRYSLKKKLNVSTNAELFKYACKQTLP